MVLLLEGDALFAGSAFGAGGVALEQGEAVMDGRILVVGTVKEAFWAAAATTWTWAAQVTAGDMRFPIRGYGMNRIQVVEGESVTLRARPTDEDGSTVFQANVETILVSVFDKQRADQTTAIYEQELLPAEVMYSTRQLDRGWRTDSTGYTFKYALPANILIEGGRVYRIEVVLRTYATGPRSLIFEAETVPLWTSRGALGV